MVFGCPWDLRRCFGVAAAGGAVLMAALLVGTPSQVSARGDGAAVFAPS